MSTIYSCILSKFEKRHHCVISCWIAAALWRWLKNFGSFDRDIKSKLKTISLEVDSAHQTECCMKAIRNGYGLLCFPLMKNVSCKYDRMVKTQLCKLRDTSDTLIGRACAIISFHLILCLWTKSTIWLFIMRPQKSLFIVRQGRGTEAAEDVFSYRLKSLFTSGCVQGDII